MKLVLSILLFFTVAGVLAYYGCTITRSDRNRNELIREAVERAIATNPETDPQVFEHEIRLFNTYPEAADVIVEFRSRQDQSKKFFRYEVVLEGGKWGVETTSPFTPPTPQP